MHHTRRFALGDILSITTGRLVSDRHMTGVSEILNFMTGAHLLTHQLPRAIDQCAPVLTTLYPQLSCTALQEALAHLDDLLQRSDDAGQAVKAWTTTLASIHGAALDVPHLAIAEQFDTPTADAIAMMGGDASHIVIVETPTDAGKPEAGCGPPQEETSIEDVLTLELGYCAYCHQEALLGPTTEDCACLVCEQCALDFIENYVCGCCGTFLTL